MGNDLIKKKFDDVEEKIDFLIELCTTLQLENEELGAKIKELEKAQENNQSTEIEFAAQDALVHEKIGRLLKKLNEFSNPSTNDCQSNL